MISLSTPGYDVSGKLNDTAAATTIRLDRLNSTLEATVCFGNTQNGSFSPSSAIPGQYIKVNLATGAIYLNGILQPVSLSPSQLSSARSELASFASQIESLVAKLGSFGGSVT